MYQLKQELRDELLDGRTVSYLANEIGITRSILSDILNSNATTKKMTAYCIVKRCKPEAEIEDYFIKMK